MMDFLTACNWGNGFPTACCRISLEEMSSCEGGLFSMDEHVEAETGQYSIPKYSGT